jgi:hypothetical protein
MVQLYVLVGIATDLLSTPPVHPVYHSMQQYSYIISRIVY